MRLILLLILFLSSSASMLRISASEIGESHRELADPNSSSTGPSSTPDPHNTDDKQARIVRYFFGGRRLKIPVSLASA